VSGGPFRLRYADGFLSAPPAAGAFETLDRPLDLAPLDAAGIDGALERPIGTAPLAEVARGARRVHLVLPDATRAGGTSALLSSAMRALERGGVGAGQVGVVFSLGLHRPPTPGERRHLLGAWEGRLQVVECRPDDETDRIDLGRTSRGTPVWLGRRALEADRLILIGSIGFHYFAGYTGGRKAVLPGLAAGASIHANHLLVLGPSGTGRDPRVGPARLDDNPVHLDMEEAAALADPSFVINSATDDAGRIVAVFAGHWRQAHREGCDWVLSRRSAAVPEPRPIVVAGAGGHPRDVNLIQSHKAMEHVQAGVSEGGALVLAAACTDGVGYERFLDWMRMRSDLAEFGRQLRRRYEVYGQTAFALAAKLRRFSIVLVSELPPDQVEAAGMIPERDLAAALKRARRIVGEAPGWWVPNAGAVLLRG
jgi:nickel-dependent lactate racemase